MRTLVKMEPQGTWEPNYEVSDFTYGAKTTTSLPPTTSTNNVTVDLPNWVETPDFLGLDANADLWNSMFVTSSGINTNVSQQAQESTDVVIDLNNKDILNIRPEDMLVPLSQLQPKKPTTTMLQAIPQPSLASQQTPVEPKKIVICVRKVSLPNAKESNPAPYIVVSPPKQNVTSQQVFPQYGSELSVVAPKAIALGATAGNQVMSPQHVVPQGVQSLIPNKQQDNLSDQLLDELMQMIDSNVKPEDLQLQDLTETLEAFDSDAFVEGSYSDTKSITYASDHGCHALHSPVPSVGSLSPCHSEKNFLSPPHSVAFVDMSSQSPQHCSTVDTLSILSPPPSVPSEVNVMSPAPSVSEFGVGSPSFSNHDTSFDASDSQDSSFDVSQDELHSYSRSSNKSKSSRRSNGARSTPYPESRRERKKEQNKQAALRYRQKKKQEEDDVLNLLRKEEEKQKELKEKYSNIKQEMTYLKKIMREVFIAKGVLSADSFNKSS